MTNLVCGIGPSAASTSRIMPSTIDEDALDLGAEIGVAGGVDDIDVGGRSVMRPFDRRAFGQDRDSTLFLEVVRIHRPLLDPLVVAEGAGLAEELVDKRRLAVIDVRDDRHVAEVHCVFRKRVSGAYRGDAACRKQHRAVGLARQPLEDFEAAFERAHLACAACRCGLRARSRRRAGCAAAAVPLR